MIRASIDSHDFDIRFCENACALCRHYRRNAKLLQSGLALGTCRLRQDKEDDEPIPVLPYETCPKFEGLK